MWLNVVEGESDQRQEDQLDGIAKIWERQDDDLN